MRQDLNLLVLVDESLCKFSFLKPKLDYLTMECIHVHVVSQFHWGQAQQWLDYRFAEWYKRLPYKQKTQLKLRKVFPILEGDSYKCIAPRIVEKPKQAKKRRIETLKLVDAVVAFWDRTDKEIKEMLTLAKQWGLPTREYEV